MKLLIHHSFYWQRDILPGLNAKQPKTVAASAAALSEAISYAPIPFSSLNPTFSDQFFSAFGVKVVAPGPIFKVLPKVFGHSDKTVRAEVRKLVILDRFPISYRFLCLGNKYRSILIRMDWCRPTHIPWRTQTGSSEGIDGKF